MLVGLCSEADVSHMIDCEGRPLPSADGTDKRGLWHFRPDGSGTWTRVDPAAVRYRPLLLAGPLRSEVMSRTTIDTRTNEMVGPVMRDYATSKNLCDELPEPRPRSIRTVFSFDSTSVDVPPECRNRTSAAAAGIVVGHDSSHDSGVVEQLVQGQSRTVHTNGPGRRGAQRPIAGCVATVLGHVWSSVVGAPTNTT